MKSVYIETSIISYLAARSSRDLRTAAWQQATAEWWDEERRRYELFTSELVVAEARLGDALVARRRLSLVKNIAELRIDLEAIQLAELLIHEGAVPGTSQADALHIAISSVHAIDYLLTWNCRHINNPARKPLLRTICEAAGYACPEICSPLELLSEDRHDAS